MKALQIIIKVILPIVIIVAGVLMWNTFKNLPPIKKEKEKANISISNKKNLSKSNLEGIPVVAHPLIPRSYQVHINTRGVAEAGEEIELNVETEGKIISLSEQFEVGTIIKKGTTLLTIDDSDLQDSLIVSQAKVAQAEAALAQEQVRAEQALINWNELGYEEQPSDLVLRKPQLRQVQASLAAAISQVELAKRMLSRVELKAPFDGIIAERLISTGERATRGKKAGRLISTEYSKLSLPLSAAQELLLPDSIEGLEVSFSNSLMREDSPEWTGFIVTREPEVDPTSKQLHLIARVLDPYSINKDTSLTLPVGQPVTAKISGTTLQDVYVVPKSALRGPETIHYISPDSTLEPLEITPIYNDQDNIVFKADLPNGLYWVETVLPSRKEGDKVILDQSLTQKDTEEKEPRTSKN